MFQECPWGLDCAVPDFVFQGGHSSTRSSVWVMAANRPARDLSRPSKNALALSGHPQGAAMETVRCACRKAVETLVLFSVVLLQFVCKWAVS